MLAWNLSPAFSQNNRIIKVMTQNMDAGTDLAFVLGLPDDPVLGAQLTYQEITTQGWIPERATRLAAEIAAAKPDLISLQEVTTWAVGPYGAPSLVLYDQLSLLMNALAERKEQYEVVDVQSLLQAFAPLNADFSQFLYFADHDVILARSDSKHSGMTLSNIQKGYYNNLFPFGPFLELLGWMSVDVEIQGTKIRFFNTHLQSPNVYFPQMAEIQVAQANELIQIMNNCTFPVILAGVFNSDASPLGIGPDLTPTAGNIQAAGYVDIWGALRPPSDLGLTWPRYLEDIYPISTSQVRAAPSERIDLIFGKGLIPLNIELTLRANPPLASDHMGVVARLRFDK